jgi:hypothetical protein
VSRRARVPAALFALALAAASFPQRAAAQDGAGVFGVAAGVGYASAAPRAASSKASLSGGAVRGQLSYGITDSLRVAATGQIAWYESRRPIVSAEFTDETGATFTGTAYGDAFTRTRLQELGLGLIYTLDVLRVVPFLGAGAGSLRAVEEVSGRTRVDYDAVLWFEVGADLAISRHFSAGASAAFDVLLARHTEFTAQTTFLLRATVLLGPAKVGRE